MDQLKAVLVQVKKYLFWILCGIVVVLSLGLSLTVSGQLGKSITTRKGEVEGAYNGVVNLAKKPSPPNDKSKQVVEESQKKLVDNVYEAWKIFYDKQPTKPANWPAALGAEFLEYIKTVPPNGPIDDKFRDTYLYFIKGAIPALMLMEQPGATGARKIYIFQMTAREKEAYMQAAGISGAEAKPEAKPDGKPAAAKPDAPPVPAIAAAGEHEEPQGIIDWVSSTEDLHRPTSAIGPLLAYQRRPTSSQIWLAQEDLWVIEALVKILGESNKGATSEYNAPVKRILALRIGVDAADAMAKSPDRVYHAGAATGGSAGGLPAKLPAGAKPPATGAPAAGGPGGTAATGASEDEQIRRALTANRYLDQNGLPASTDAFAEFKMMPVYLELGVDQKSLPKVLAACANSPMPVVVRRVAIRPEENKPLEMSALASAGRGAGSGETGRSSGPRGPASAPRRPRGGGAGPEGGRGSAAVVSPDEMTVEIQGIIYIFNPPQKELIGTGAATGPAQAGASSGKSPAPTAPATKGPAAPAPTPGAATPGAPTTPAPGPSGPPASGATPGAPTTPTPTPVGPTTASPPTPGAATPPVPAPTGKAPAGPGTPAPTPSPPAGPPSKGGAPPKT